MRNILIRSTAATAVLFVALSLALVAFTEEGAEQMENGQAETLTAQFYEQPLMALPEVEEAQAEAEQAEAQQEEMEMETIDEATATLLSTERGLFVDVDTRDLTEDNVYTLWIVTVNEPENCQETPCSMEDIMERNEEAQIDVGYVGGAIAREDGSGSLSGYQPTGELTQAWYDAGLEDPMQAEVHLIVRDHGPVVEDLAETMINTFRGGCSDESLPEELPETAREDGEAGPNTCQDVQVAIFEQEAAPVARTQQ